MVGGEAMSGVALAMEKAGRAGNTEDLERLLPALGKAFSRLRIEMSRGEIRPSQE